MTVVVGAAAPDGIILSAESRTSLFDGDRHRIASDSTQKVFSICDSVAVATYGLAFFSDKTIAGVMDEFVTSLGDEPPATCQAVADALASFGHDRFVESYPDEDVDAIAALGHPLGFLVAGYDDDGVGRIREVGVPGHSVETDFGIGGVTTASLGVLWRGETDVIRRVVKGVDWDLLQATGVTIPDEVEQHLRGLEYHLLFPITLEDAVDFTRFLIATTIEMQRFSNGTMLTPSHMRTCGGAVRTIAVTRAGIEWVTEPPL